MRLIDADEVRLHKGFFEKVTNVPKFYEWLDSLPTVDAVPVVRCGECMQRDEKTGWCDAVEDYISNTNWFCAGGVRKDGVDDEALQM